MDDNNQQERELRITWPHNPRAQNLKRQEIRKLFKQKLPDDPIDGDPCANVGYVLVSALFYTLGIRKVFRAIMKAATSESLIYSFTCNF